MPFAEELWGSAARAAPRTVLPPPEPPAPANTSQETPAAATETRGDGVGDGTPSGSRGGLRACPRRQSGLLEPACESGLGSLRAALPSASGTGVSATSERSRGAAPPGTDRAELERP